MRTVLVTGGARGIGKSVCEAFSAEGCFIIINYNESEKDALALSARLGNSAVFRADVSKSEDVSALLAAFPEIDVLVNNAGVSLFGPFDSIGEDQARRLYEVNLFGTLNTSRLLMPSMIRRKSGVIINIASVWGECGASCEVDYSASKAAVIGFTKALAKEIGPSGIRVNCVCPGVIDTEMNMHLSITEMQTLIESIPLERLGKPRDVAEAVLFLASEKADYINGAVLSVNGGLF